MCGHATIALGRFLVDTHDLAVFPRREGLQYDFLTQQTRLRLHAPCGIIHVQVPTIGGKRSDEGKAVDFLGVPSFVSAMNKKVEIPRAMQWKGLVDAKKETVVVDVAYGGAFYVIVSAAELGFPGGLRGSHGLQEFDEATRVLKDILGREEGLCRHPREGDLEYLYGVMVVDKTMSRGGRGETGLCYFGNQQVDRSPTGSCVSARVAVGIERGELEMGEEWTYESLVSIGSEGMGFTGTGVGKTEEGVIVRVQGRAFYTAATTFVRDPHDPLHSGFLFK